MTDEQRAFERGCVFAFDEILNWINTQTDQYINKKDLYRYVLHLVPKAIFEGSKKYESIT